MDEKDLLAIKQEMERKRLEIEREIEEKRKAVELEIASKRKALDDRLNSQRNEMQRRHDEQVRNMNRQINARELAARIEAEFNAGKELVESGIVAGEQYAPVAQTKNVTADADILMQKMLAETLAEEEAKRKVEEETKRQAEEEAKRKAVEEEKRQAEEKAKRHLEEEELLRKAKEEAQKKEENAKHKAEVEEVNRKAKEELKRIAEKELERKQTAEKAKIEQKKQEVEKETIIAATALSGDDGGQKTEMKKKSKIHWGRLIIFIVAVILVALIFFFGTIFVVRQFVQNEDVGVVYPRSKVVTLTDEQGNILDSGEKIESVEDERINVLVMGSDYGDSEAEKDDPKRTDAMMLLSFDPQNKKVSVLSIPRDTMVILPGHKLPETINAAYAFGGVMMAKQTVANLLGVPITHYALADWQAFTKVVDLMGGVDLLVEHDMKYDDPYADLHIDLKKGFQHLNGKQAGQYVRYRSDELGDIGRAQRQQKFLRAAMDQVFSVANITKIPSLISMVCDNVETDMNVMTMLKALNSIKLIDKERVKTGTLGGDFVEENDISYWKTDEAAIRKALKDLEIPSSKLK
ncbi:MAG: LCP family protein [Acidaminococcaceae bacterium]|nr:LCP family protein [Acidaminococcaceae bacterium]